MSTETEASFLRSERDAVHRFMAKFVNEDFLSKPGDVAYAREYRCGCGFRTDDPKVIFEHAHGHENAA